MKRSLTLSLLLLSLCALPGCETKTKRALSSSSDRSDQLSQTRTQLDQAYDMLVRMDEFERAPATTSIVSFLNNHLSEQQADPQWKPDALVARLPRHLRSLPPVERLDSLEVQSTDALYCEEVYLLRNIGNWVTKQEPPPALATWAKSPEAKLNEDQRETLLAAAQLFDWTVRNVQLDPLPKPPPEAVAGPSGNDPAQANAPAPLRGLIGPGYTALPWYVLMCGHGDAWQRMRIFTLLARQQGIDVVTLALPDPADENKTRPWASGVLIGTQLYLFDSALGLPIPGPGRQGIATLEQLRSDGALLRELDVDQEHPYDVSSEELKNVTALIDAPLESLSQRMQLVERGLTGERQLKLTFDPSELAARVRKSPGIANVVLWPVPVEAMLFNIALHESPVFDPVLRYRLLTERNLIENRALVGSPRNKHLLGKFSDTLDKKGAKSNYLETRGFFLNMLTIDKPSSFARKFDEINASFDRKSTKDVVERTPEGQKQLEYLVELNNMLQYVKEKQGEKKQLEKFGEIQNTFALGRDECSYWLGLAHYDSGNYKAAVDWLDGRTLQVAPSGQWSNGARYNLARAYEHLKANNLAQELYLADESPQQHGNLLRAKWLSKP